MLVNMPQASEGQHEPFWIMHLIARKGTLDSVPRDTWPIVTGIALKCCRTIARIRVPCKSLHKFQPCTLKIAARCPYLEADTHFTQILDLGWREGLGPFPGTIWSPHKSKESANRTFRNPAICHSQSTCPHSV